MKKQIEFLKEHNITNYTIESGKITINGGLYLRSLTSVPTDFLKNTTINGYLDLSSLTSVPTDLLKNTTINGCLYLSSLTSVPTDFLKNTTINGYLDLRSLTQKHRNLANKNVKKLQVGYNKKLSYCFFDGILSKVLSVKKTKGYIIYTTPFEYIAQKDGKTAHGKTVKKAISDLEFKFLSEKLKNDPINENTIITDQYYRAVTGACESGIENWKKNNNITVNEITAGELLPILEKTKPFGFEKFKKLMNK